MKKVLILLLICFIYGHATSRDIVLLNSDWKFAKGSNENAFRPEYDDSNWENVSIPHDWAIEGPFIIEGNGKTGKLPWKGEAWYRKRLQISPDLADKVIYLQFDGIMAFPKIYLNGKLAGSWDYGYNSFYLDVTDLIHSGSENVLAIHVDTRQHDSRWYPGAGIYRKIQMIAADPIHVDIWGSYITTPSIKSQYSDVRIAHRILNKSRFQKDSIKVENMIINPAGMEIARDSTWIDIPAGKSRLTETTFTLNKPEKWDIENPAMYFTKIRISLGGNLLDEHLTPFGIRSIRFTADNGFFLNDRRVQLKGVNLHHDHGPLGAAFNPRAMERQLEIMKNMGCNAIRTSHNVAAPELLELCDRMGLLVLNEVFDKYDAKADFTDTTDFDCFAYRNIRNFILRDRNHPSVFLWSVGNEIKDVMFNRDNGYYRLHTLVNYVNKYDPSRPVTLVSSVTETAKLRHFDYYDVHCWNYGQRYSLARQIEPNKSVIISESASTLSTRGFYELPLPEKKTDFTNSLQISSYDLNAPMWAEIPDDDFMWQEEENYIAGEFVWTGFDYLGEPTPYDNKGVTRMGMTDREASRSSYFGIVDLCGIPKDRYYLYKSYWKQDELTVHILPHWNWEGMEGKELPVFVYTNGDAAELFLNGVSQGIQRKVVNSPNSSERYRLIWDKVKYSTGKVRAVAYRNGEAIGENMIQTTGKPNHIKLTPDRSRLKAGIRDLSYILVEVCDKNGDVHPLADNLIEFNIEGAGQIAGVGNGNPQSFANFKSNQVQLFYGRAMLIMEAGENTGEILIKASSRGLEEAITSLNVK